GQLSWTYGDFTFAGNVTVREVQQRQLVKQYGATSTNYVISRTSGDANTTTVHSSAFLDDPGGVGQRAWAFSTDTTQPAILGLPTAIAWREYQSGTIVVRTRDEYTYVQDSAGRPYVGTVL